jgi:hypothetical protein
VREHDYLNRWPFAQEIYGIATTGPRDWSVRSGYELRRSTSDPEN